MKIRPGLTLAVVLISTALPAIAGDRWMHIRVQDGEDGENVSLDLPVESVSGFLPLIEENAGQTFGSETDEAQLRAVLVALREAPDGEFLKVEGKGESARVAKDKEFLLIHADEEGERVRIRLPLAVVEAALGDETDGLDLAAGLRALERFDGQDLLTVEGDGEQVRIWIDTREGGN
jgi:hypothetical protein